MPANVVNPTQLHHSPGHDRRPTEAALLLAHQLAGLFVDEMNSSTGSAGDGLVSIIGRLSKPLLHAHAGLRTFENDVSAHR
jgi:hypothetical protein